MAMAQSVSIVPELVYTSESDLIIKRFAEYYNKKEYHTIYAETSNSLQSNINLQAFKEQIDLLYEIYGKIINYNRIQSLEKDKEPIVRALVKAFSRDKDATSCGYVYKAEVENGQGYCYIEIVISKEKDEFKLHGISFRKRLEDYIRQQ